MRSRSRQLAAAVAGAQVVGSDRSPHALAFAAASAEENHLEVQFVPCEWACPEQLLEHAPWDIVLAADVLYDESAAKALLDLLPQVVAGGGEAVIADPGRRLGDLFLAQAAVDWRVESLRWTPPVVIHRLRRRQSAP